MTLLVEVTIRVEFDVRLLAFEPQRLFDQSFCVLDLVFFVISDILRYTCLLHTLCRSFLNSRDRCHCKVEHRLFIQDLVITAARLIFSGSEHRIAAM